MIPARGSRLRIILFGVAILFVAGVIGGAPRTERRIANSATNQAPPNRLVLVRVRQPGAPLIVVRVISNDSGDPLMPTIRCTIKNTSARPIMAYAVKHEAVFERRTGTVSGAVTYNNTEEQNAVLPGDIREIEIYGVQYGEMPQSVSVSVDFVEFLDGSRWGPDTLKNGEVIDGARAGVKAEAVALMAVLATKGVEGVMQLLESIQPEPDDSLPRSPEWLDGFRGGVGWVRERVRSKRQNLIEIESELRSRLSPKEKRSQRQ